MKILGNKQMSDSKKNIFSWGTKTEVAKRLGVSRQVINHRIKTKNLDVLQLLVKVEKEKKLKEKELEKRANEIIAQLSSID